MSLPPPSLPPSPLTRSFYNEELGVFGLARCLMMTAIVGVQPLQGSVGIEARGLNMLNDVKTR